MVRRFARAVLSRVLGRVARGYRDGDMGHETIYMGTIGVRRARDDSQLGFDARDCEEFEKVEAVVRASPLSYFAEGLDTDDCSFRYDCKRLDRHYPSGATFNSLLGYAKEGCLELLVEVAKLLGPCGYYLEGKLCCLEDGPERYSELCIQKDTAKHFELTKPDDDVAQAKMVELVSYDVAQFADKDGKLPEPSSDESDESDKPEPVKPKKKKRKKA